MREEGNGTQAPAQRRNPRKLHRRERRNEGAAGPDRASGVGRWRLPKPEMRVRFPSPDPLRCKDLRKSASKMQVNRAVEHETTRQSPPAFERLQRPLDEQHLEFAFSVPLL